MENNALGVVPQSIKEALDILAERGLKVTPDIGGFGVGVDLPSGWIVSVQCGPGHYCSNRDPARQFTSSEELGFPLEHWLQSWTAEVAVIDAEGQFFKMPEAEQIELGWQQPQQVLYIVEAVERIAERRALDEADEKLFALIEGMGATPIMLPAVTRSD